MDALPAWSRRRSVVLSCCALAFAGVVAAGIATWKTTGGDDGVAFSDVVGAVLVRGRVFHAQCSSSSGGATTTTFEQWYSPDLGATRTEVAADGKLLFTEIVTVREGVDLSASTNSVSPHLTEPNASGLGLGPPEMAVVHLGSLAATKDVTFARSGTPGGRTLVEATALRVRPLSEAGEDEPAGGLQNLTWQLDGRTLLPISAHFVETRPDGSGVQSADITCSMAELLDATEVDPSLFDINALKQKATAP